MAWRFGRAAMRTGAAGGERPPGCPPPPPLTVADTRQTLAEEAAALGLEPGAQPAALCLSGGGIRSAAFCLGVLQALARRHLLGHFHYLSTVSGGGYVGAWLTRCIAARNPARGSTIDAVEQTVLTWTGAEEPPELRALRRYTDFLTPRPGIASADTWAGIMLWLRNTLINWAVFFPLFLAVAALPVAYEAAIHALATSAGLAAQVIAGVLAVAGFASLGVSVFLAATALPSHRFPDSEADLPAGERFGLTGAAVFRRIVLPVAVWSFLAPLAAVPWSEAPRWPLFGLPLGSLAASFAAYCGAWAWAGRGGAHWRAFWVNLPGWAASCLVSAGVLAAGLFLAIGRDPLPIAIAGPLWTVGAELLRTTLYVALRRDALRTDLDREWLARLSGSKLRLLLGYAAGATAALALPILVLDNARAAWAALVSFAGFLGGPVAALLGKAATTSFTHGVKSDKKPIWANTAWIIAVAITAFIAALLMLLGRLASLIADGVAARLAGPAAGALGIPAEMALLLATAGCGVAWLIDRAVNLNHFSMHAVYRNRLVRAFLGSARLETERHPDRYTGFDPTDNVRVADTFTNRTPKALFPVINVTLNVTQGGSTARAERKGEPFTITPLRSGAAGLARVAGTARGAYLPTACFAGAGQLTGPGDCERGITLGTAITLSGAAVSPNMGYHSSFFTAFVMTLFNLRLGAWLPNPGWIAAGPARPDGARVAASSGPIHAIPTMLMDLLGLSDDRSEYVYLSDGGHFDNLGLYEMLRRRCGYIVVADAGQDAEYGYFDLGHALQRAKIDLGVTVTFDPAIAVGAGTLPRQGGYATIAYPATNALPPACGELLYLKPWLPADAPVELLAFQRAQPSFPHTPTADQFFTESDFESYRKLGEYLAGLVLPGGATQDTLMLKALFALLRPAAPAGPETWPTPA